MFDNKAFTLINRDKELEELIIRDMEENAGIFMPHSHWDNVNRKFCKSENQSLTFLLDDFIGSEGLKPISQQQKLLYEHFFSKIDNLDLSKYLNSNSISTDYGSIMDINLINIFNKHNQSKVLRVCEVGGGYGRLAKVITNYYKKSVKYVLVDSVAVSIMFSYQFLKNQCPEAKIGFYYNNDDFDLDKYDIYIVPSWHFEKMNKYQYDIAINIESMQEMNYEEIERFMNIFNDCVKENGIIYLSNSKEYVFKGNWPYPENWECLFRHNTPRSWTKNHPTEVFKRSTGVFKEKEVLFEFYTNIEELYKIGFDGNATQFLSRNELEKNIEESYANILGLTNKVKELEDELNGLYSSKSYRFLLSIKKLMLIFRK